MFGKECYVWSGWPKIGTKNFPIKSKLVKHQNLVVLPQENEGFCGFLKIFFGVLARLILFDLEHPKGFAKLI